MNIRTNTKAVVILVGGLATLAVAVHFLHGYQVKRNSRDLYEQAVMVEQEGQLAQAADYLNQYLGMTPGDDEALARLGVLLDRLAKTPPARVRAFYVLEQVLRRDSARSDIRRRVARIAIELGQHRDAEHHLQLLLKDNSEDAELLHFMGRCAMALRNYEEARDWYTKALKLAPDQIELALEYAELLRSRLKVAALADARIETMIRANEKSPEARKEAARYFARHGLWEEAEKHVQFAIQQLGLEDVEVLLLAADIARARAKPAEARKYLERGQQLYPKDTRMTQALARMELLDGDRARAMRYLDESFKELPVDADHLWALAQLYLEVGDLERAGTVAKRLGQGGATTAMSCVQAQILMQEQAWGEARQVLEKLRTGQRTARYLARQIPYLRALCYERLANPDQSLVAYQQAVDADPRWAAARRGLALSFAAVGQTDRALDEFRSAAADEPQFRGELIRMLIARNSRLSVAGQPWDEVEKLLNDLTPAGESPAEVQMLRAQMLAARGKLAEAEKLLETQRQRDPRQVAPWLFLASLAQRRGQMDAVLPLLADAERQAGRSAEWDVARAMYWARVGGKQAPERLRQLEAGVSKLAEPDQPRLLQALAEAFDALGATPAADSLWRDLAQRQPKDLLLQFTFLERALAAGKRADVQSSLERIKQIEGEGGPMTAYAEAANLVAQARVGDLKLLAEARTRLAQAAKLRPTWSRVPLLEAQALDLENRKDKALQKYQTALDRGEGRFFVVRRVLQLLCEQQRYGEAQALVRKLSEQALAMRELGQIAAALALAAPGQDRPDAEGREQALRLARKAAADNPKDYRDQLWLGQVAAAAGQMEEAEKAMRQARTLADTEPVTWASLILYLAPRNPKQAEAELASAAAKVAKDELPPLRAAAYEALGRIPQAEEQYLAVLAVKPGDVGTLYQAASFFTRNSQPVKAETWLRKLTDPRTGAAQTVVGWARRELALVLAYRGTYQQFREAVDLLEANKQMAEETMDDRRVKGLVLATEPARRREAIGLLEHLPVQDTGTRFVLAQLYEREDNWLKARLTFNALLNDQAKNPTFVAAYVAALRRHKEIDEAERWVNHLTTIAPQAFETVELRAHMLKEKGKAKEAVALVKAYAADKDARLDRVALLLDQLGQADEAEALGRSLAAAPKRPEDVLAVARVLARKRLPEALTLCEQAWKTCPPEIVGFTSVTVLEVGQGDSAQYQRVERWLTAAIAKHPASMALPVAYARLQQLRGQYDDAIKLYRQVLDRSSTNTAMLNAVALNNLAYLLAMTGGNLAEAEQFAQQALDLAGPGPQMFDTRAVMRLKGNQPEKAIADVEQAIGQSPSPVFYFHLAQAQHLVRNRTAAVAALRQAGELGLTPASVPRLEQAAYHQLVEGLAQ